MDIAQAKLLITQTLAEEVSKWFERRAGDLLGTPEGQRLEACLRIVALCEEETLEHFFSTQKVRGDVQQREFRAHYREVFDRRFLRWVEKGVDTD